MSQDIYIMGMCGTGTGALAGMLKALGHRVRGSDQGVYPPMSEKLKEWEIPLCSPFDAKNLNPKPDLIIVGNVIRENNPEAVAMRELGIPFMSMPQAVAEFGIQNKHSIVVAGTHGKTTTSALCSHLALELGLDPSFLVGGVLIDYRDSFRVGAGDLFVVEGDEYDTAYFDKGPKFVHYRAQTAIITSLEFDHADIYDSVEAIEASFLKLIKALPQNGHLIVWEGAHRALDLAKKHGGHCRITIYGITSDADLRATELESGPLGHRFTPVFKGQKHAPLLLPLYGDHSVQNGLAVWASLFALGVKADALASAFASFKGVQRRMQLLGEVGGVSVIDDFGHHPTAIAETLKGARMRFLGARLWAIFEPRSATARRKVLQDEFADALAVADIAIVASHSRMKEVPEDERFSPQDVAARISRHEGKEGIALASVDDIVLHVQKHARAQDAILVFSNGAFDGLQQKLLDALASGLAA